MPIKGNPFLKQDNSLWSKNQIKQAARCCLDCNCNKCPYRDKPKCEEQLKKDLFGLLDNQEAEIERLKAQIKEVVK